MIKINKTNEPIEWRRYRETSGTSYQALPELRDSLLKEQGYLCAYCMRRIPVGKPEDGATSKIEHLKCRKIFPEEQLNYNNMVACCPGAMNGQFHCDKSKRSDAISFNLFRDGLVETLRYSSKDGKITSTNTDYNKEIQNVLNLNHPLLKSNRLHVIKAVIKRLSKKDKWTTSSIQKELIIWKERNQNNQFKSYAGVVIWYLSKKIDAVNKLD